MWCSRCSSVIFHRSWVQISIQLTAVLTGPLLRIFVITYFESVVTTADISHIGHQRFLPDPLPKTYALNIQSPDPSVRAVCGCSPAETCIRILREAWMSVCYECCVLHRADHSSRGFLLTVVCRCVSSRNLKYEEATAHVGQQRQNKHQINRREHL